MADAALKLKNSEANRRTKKGGMILRQKEYESKQVKKAICGICASGCPMDVYVEDGKITSVEGSRDLPGQRGGLCAKGAASTLYV